MVLGVSGLARKVSLYQRESKVYRTEATARTCFLFCPMVTTSRSWVKMWISSPEAALALLSLGSGEAQSK